MKKHDHLLYSIIKRFIRRLAVLAMAITMMLPVSTLAVNPPERISVAYCSDCVPFHFSDEDGQPAGIIFDLWRLWSEKTGIAIDFRAASWDETLAMVGSGVVDAHAGLFFNEERDKFLDYGTTLAKTDTHYFTHTALPPVYELEDLGAYRIGVIEGDYVEGYLGERLPEGTVVPFSDYNAIMSALRKGILRVFAADTPTGLYHLKKSGLSSEFTFVSEKPLYQNDWFVAVREGNAPLLEVINRGMALVTEEERRVINRRWIASTGEESETLIIAINRAYAPLSFINALGRPSGLFVDMWRTWAEETGRQIQFRPTGWNETLDGLRAGEADIHSGLSFSTEQTEWIDYSSQIYETYTRAYHRINEDLPADIDAYDNRVIGVGFNTYQEERLRKEHPEANIRSYGSNQELIDALLKGEIDAIVQEEQLMKAELDRLGVRAEIATRPERLFPSTIHAGILKENPELLAQINDGFGAIPKETLAGLEKRWIPDPKNHFYRADSKAIILSSDEKAWLSKHPVLRLSSETDWPPFDFAIDGKPSGFSIDFMDLIAQKLGISTQYVTGPLWSEFLNMLESGEIEAVHTIYESEKRKKRFNFTNRYYYRNIIGIFTRKEDNSIQSLKDLSGKTIALPEGYALVPVLERENPDIEIVRADTMVAAIKALSRGEIDAVVESAGMLRYLVDKHSIADLKLACFADFKHRKASDYTFKIAVSKDNPQLAGILDKAIESISDEETMAIESKWFGSVSHRLSEGVARINLTERERTWLSGHRKIRLGIDPAWAPFEFVSEDGRYSGISSGYVAAIRKRIATEMTPIMGLIWSQVIEKAKRGEIDVLPAVVPTVDRKKYLSFTKPYISLPIVIATRKDAQFIGSLDDLKGRRVAVVKDYYIEEVLTRTHPELDIITYPTLNEGLKGLDAGGVDAFIDNLGVISYEITRAGLGSIKIAAPTKLTFDLAMGVRKDWPELVGILNKALSDLSNNEKTAIRNTWMAFQVNYGLDFRTILIWAIPIGSCIILIIFFIVIWNRRLSVEVNERKEKEQLIQLSSKISQSLTTGGALRKTLQSVTDMLVRDLNVVFARIWIVDEIENKLILQASSGLYTHIKGPHERLPIGGDTKIGRVVSEKRPHTSNRILDSPYVKDKEWVKEQGLKAFAGIPMVVEERSVGALVVFSRKDIPEDAVQTILAVAGSIAVAIERNRAELTVRESEERNRMLLDSAGAGIFGVDLEGKITFINPAATEMLGYSEDELVNQHVHPLIHHSHPDGSPYPTEECPIYQAYTKGMASHERDEMLWRKDGTSFYVSYTATPTMKNNELVGAMVTFMDISEQSKAEDALQERLNELTTARLSMLNMMEDLEDTRKESEKQNVELQSEVTERKKIEEELRLNMEDLERFSDMAVGREEKMIQLKEEINELMAQLGRGEKYTIV